MNSPRYQRQQGNKEPKGQKTTAKKVVISYIYLDRAQGQSLEQWDRTAGRLLRWENIVQRLNTLTVAQALAQQDIIKYNNLDADQFNMPKNSMWKYPAHLNHLKIVWCKIIVMQLVRVIGFMDDNVFYVVFLDEKHEFYPTEPKNT